jgi:tetratricopeptide (TPR) repeat protein
MVALRAADSPQALGARYAVEGSIRRQGERVEVTVRVREAASGENVWANRYEGATGDLPRMQDEILANLVGELEPALLRLEQVRAERRRADAIAVWDLCRQAEHQLGSETTAGYARAVSLFEQAIAIDGESPSAWSGLALGHGAAIYLGLVDDLRAVSTQALEAADRAMRLAPGDFDSRFTLGRCLALSKDDLAAVPILEDALESDPSSGLAASTLAGALRRQGRADAAVPWYERALRVSPRSPQLYHVHGGLALALLARGDYEGALSHASLATRGDEGDGGGRALDFYPVVPASLALLGRIDEARAAWASAGEHVSRERMRHSARFTGAGLEALAEGLRLAGWDGRLD